jgi:nucleoside-diphosphate-sugar epimerase
MKLLVVGGAGYIGSVLVPALVEAGHDVHVVDLLWFGNHLPPEVKVFQKDVLKLEAQDVEGYDQVIFLAGLSNDPMAAYDPVGNYIQNAAAPVYLAHIAKDAGVRRFIFASSCSVYGDTRGQCVDETYACRPVYSYGQAKLMAEDGLMRMVGADFSVVGLRQGTVCGWSPRLRLDLIVQTMFRDAVSKKKITVRNPRTYRPLLIMKDAVQAYLKALTAPQSISTIVNVASGNYTVAEVAQDVRAYFTETEIEELNFTELRDYKVQVRKAAHDIGYMPSYMSVYETVKELARYLLDGKHWAINCDDPRYYNIETMKLQSATAWNWR